MFAPGYFAPQYFAPEYFPPGDIAEVIQFPKREGFGAPEIDRPEKLIAARSLTPENTREIAASARPSMDEAQRELAPVDERSQRLPKRRNTQDKGIRRWH